MEVRVLIHASAAAAYVFCMLWKVKKLRHGSHRPDASSLFLAGALAVGLWAFLNFTVCPDACAASLIGCSITLICVSARRETLLPTHNRAVLVTGCDSGFGHALAVLLSEMGVKVFAGVLDVEGPGAQRLRQRHSENLQVLQLDVTEPSQVEVAYHHIRAQVADTGLWGLVNNAGVLHCLADTELQPLAVYRRCMEVNFLSAVHMCQQFLPLLRQARGRIVNVSSMAGEVPLPTFGAYGASKAALSLFTRVMRLELREWGVSVAIIQPAGFRTKIFGNSKLITHYTEELLAGVSSEAREDYGYVYISSLPRSLSLMSQQMAEDLSPVVDAMCHALLAPHPRVLYSPGQMGWLLPFLHRCCPNAMFDAIITRLFRYTDCQPAGLQRR
ncbi:17-beta-hydroxysteroid dehydrogenase type 2 [Parambassis ranga]|uniref:17-beta-hydroxysteroid dehydrogenase type 2 n=1 Tax=Parambassis ranga TaxID=210632 RepID=A0A6P7KG49_9TELE|nr:estradiol 17-beta-dehydrogenase 2-like [Parambassis ranga]